MKKMSSEKKDLVVMKFGGSCLQDAASFKQTTNIIKKYLEKSKVIIVLRISIIFRDSLPAVVH